MFIVGCEMTLVSDAPVSDAIDGLIDALVEELDDLGLNPDISTVETDAHTVVVTIEVGVVETVAGSDIMDAFVYGMSSIKSALHGAGVATDGLVISELTPHTPRTLQPA